jgi:hypothetical protein
VKWFFGSAKRTPVSREYANEYLLSTLDWSE